MSKFLEPLVLPEQVSPTTPDLGFLSVYGKSDGLWYKTSGGADVKLAPTSTTVTLDTNQTITSIKTFEDGFKVGADARATLWAMTGNGTYLSDNAKLNAAENGWEYATATAGATSISQVGGEIQFYTAPTSTGVGQAVTFTRKAEVNSSGFELSAGSILTHAGHTSAPTNTRWIGGMNAGPPTGGSWSVGDWLVTTSGRVVVCTTAGSPGTWSDAGEDNVRNSGLKRFRESLATVSTKPVDILWMGDSITEGYSATSDTNRFQNIFTSRLQSIYNPTTVKGTAGYVPVLHSVTGTSLDSNGWTLGGGWAAQGGADSGFGLGRRYVYLDATGEYAEYTFTGDRFWILYSTGTGVGDFTVTIDGGAPTTVSAYHATTNRSGNVWDSGALTDGAHTVRVTATNTNASFPYASVILEGIMPFRGDGGATPDTGAGIRSWDAGHAGYQATHFDNHDAASGYWLKALPNIYPDLVFISFGVNDLNGSVSATTFQTRLTSIITNIRSNTTSNPSIVIVANHFSASASATTIAQYLAVMEATAATNGCSFVDLTKILPAPTSSASALYADNVHPNDAGMRAIADALTNAVIGTAARFPATISGTPSNMVTTDTAQTITGPKTFQSTGTSVTPIIVKQNNPQSTNLTAWQDYNGNIMSRINFAGALVINANNSPNILVNPSVSTNIGVVIKGALNHSGNLTEWQDNNSAILARVASNGDTYVPRIRISSANDVSLSSTTHGFQIGSSTGQNLSMDGNEIMSRNNGAGAALYINLDGGITYLGPDGTIISGTSIISPLTDVVPLVLRGITSGTANILEVQNPAGSAVLSRIDAAGAIYDNGNRVYSGSNPPPAPDLSSYATTTYVDGRFTTLIGAAPAALDTLSELADALADDANYAASVTSALAGKVNLTGNETIAGIKTFSSSPVVPDSSWTIAKTTGLQTALDAKAADSAVVHLTGAETIAGVKTFSSAPIVPDASFSIAKLSATGTRDATTVLHGDGTWAVVEASGGTEIIQQNEPPANPTVGTIWVDTNETAPEFMDVEPYPFSFTGTLTTKVGTFRLPIADDYVVESIQITAGTAPTGAAIIVDVNKNGTTMYTTQANRPSIAAGTNMSVSVAPDVTTLGPTDWITVDIDQVGSTVAGADLMVLIRLRRT